MTWGKKPVRSKKTKQTYQPRRVRLGPGQVLVRRRFGFLQRRLSAALEVEGVPGLVLQRDGVVESGAEPGKVVRTARQFEAPEGFRQLRGLAPELLVLRPEPVGLVRCLLVGASRRPRHVGQVVDRALVRVR
jgi:hypothetical protein